MSNDANDWWDQAVQRNRRALLRIAAVLFVYAGLDEGGAETLPRHAWRMILRLLRPAESAARRLIVIAARDISVEAPARRAERAPSAIERLQAAGLLVFRGSVDLGLARAPQPQAPAGAQKSASRLPAFPLADPPRRFDTRSWNGARPFPQAGFQLGPADEPVSATRLCRRLRALKQALDDLPGHAARLARREARRTLAAASTGQRLAAYDNESLKLKGANIRAPLRPGHPPGRRKRPVHTVDDILRECHDLALTLRRSPDTS